MADETFEIAFEVSGEGDAAKAFQDLKVAEEQAQQAGRALSGEMRSGVTSSLRTVATAAQQQSTNVGQLGQRWGQVGSALGQVGSVVGQLSPQMGQLGQIVGQVGGATTALSGAMGPLGIAAAAVTTAMGLFAYAMQQSEQEIQSLRREADRTKRSFDDLVGALQNAQQHRARWSAVGLGVAGPQEQEAALTQAYTRRNVLERQVREAAEGIERRRTAGQGIFVGEEETLAGLRAQLRQAETFVNQRREALRQTITDETQSMAEDLQTAADEWARREDARNRHRTAAHHDEVGERMQREEEFYGHLAELEEQYQNDLQIRADQRAQREEQERADTASRIRDMHDFFLELDQQSIDAQLANIQRRQEAEEAALEKRKEGARMEFEEAQRQQQQLSEITNTMWSSLGDTVLDAAGQMFKFLISGSDKSGDAFLKMLDAFLEATAIQYTIKALAEGAEAIASFARYDYPSGVQHLAAAGLAAAVAAATGIAAAAINVPTAPSAGGGAQSVGAAVSPTAGGTAQHVTIQLFAPQAVFTEAERGQLMASGIREARRQLGPSAARI